MPGKLLPHFSDWPGGKGHVNSGRLHNWRETDVMVCPNPNDEHVLWFYQQSTWEHPSCYHYYVHNSKPLLHGLYGLSSGSLYKQSSVLGFWFLYSHQCCYWHASTEGVWEVILPRFELKPLESKWRVDLLLELCKINWYISFLPFALIRVVHNVGFS